MATGLTYPVKDRDDYTFPEFLWKCAKQFGPLVHMREESSDAPIRLPRETGDVLGRANDDVQRALEQLEKCLARTPEDWDREAETYHERALKNHAETVATKKKELRRFKGMLAQVTAWDPPTPEHRELKSFMIEQLSNGIDFDCQMPETPVRRSATALREEEERFYRRALASAEESLERHRKSHGFSRNWILALAESVPLPAHMTPVGGLK